MNFNKLNYLIISINVKPNLKLAIDDQLTN